MGIYGGGGLPNLQGFFFLACFFSFFNLPALCLCLLNLNTPLRFLSGYIGYFSLVPLSPRHRLLGSIYSGGSSPAARMAS
jgi:hypothetical protein